MSEPPEPPDGAWTEWGGKGPRLVLCHANGFVPGCYRTLIARLRSDFRVATFAARPLWGNAEPAAVGSWLPLAGDLTRLLEARGETGVVGVGHSLGGVLAALSAAAAPSRFTALVLLDPVVFSGGRAFLWGWMKRLGLGSRSPLARGARRRRDRWPDLEAVRARWQARAMFRGWDPRALEDYLEASVTEAADGTWVLRYPRAWEARIFEICPHDLWPRLRRVEPPTLVVRGSASDTLLPGAALRMAREMPDATVLELEGTSHFLPMEKPEEVARLIVEFTGGSGLAPDP
ncbi:MAG TPA: alpha/beta hydrolase [Candidatus Sulfomarinibacteraceae bacterium]|nr:alpha/beta hydrolase [Candidatus Sulfomarinibacteraceae bacterium]